MDLLILLAVALVSQSPAAEFPKDVQPGTKVFVIDWTGAERAGTIVSASVRGITLDQKDGLRTTVPLEYVARVERTDGLQNGFFIGAGIGALLSGVWDLKHDGWGLRCLQFGFYTGIGVFVDWLREGRSVVYQAERRPAVSVAPLVGPRAAGVALRVGF